MFIKIFLLCLGIFIGYAAASFYLGRLLEEIEKAEEDSNRKLYITHKDGMVTTLVYDENEQMYVKK